MPNTPLVVDAASEIEPLVLLVDGFPDREHTRTTSIGREPLETGAKITDHAVAEPATLRLTGIVSNMGGVERPVAAWQAIERIIDDKEPVRVTTEWGVIDEAIIARARSKPVGRSMRFEIAVQAVERVETAVVFIPPPTPPAVSASTGRTINDDLTALVASGTLLGAAAEAGLSLDLEAIGAAMAVLSAPVVTAFGEEVRLMSIRSRLGIPTAVGGRAVSAFDRLTDKDIDVLRAAHRNDVIARVLGDKPVLVVSPGDTYDRANLPAGTVVISTRDLNDRDRLQRLILGENVGPTTEDEQIQSYLRAVGTPSPQPINRYLGDSDNLPVGLKAGDFLWVKLGQPIPEGVPDGVEIKIRGRDTVLAGSIQTTHDSRQVARQAVTLSRTGTVNRGRQQLAPIAGVL